MSEADLHAMVEVHMTGYREEFNLSKALGRGFIRATYTFFLTDRKSFGFGVFVNDRLAGYVLGRLDYFSDDLNRYWPRIFALARALICRPTLLADARVRKQLFGSVGRVCAKAFRCNKPEPSLENAPSHAPGKTATISSTCVDHTLRVPHASHYLLEAAENLCRENGMQFLRASIHVGNTPCRFLHTLRKYAVDEVLTDEESVYYYISFDEQTQ
ncbi:MAG: hypothetical protein HQ567_17840 [Candidatus Nealsonbacteria bacterium]|nr:hypothetical protein [Candidatus Nealsonbacteria bacterium]